MKGAKKENLKIAKRIFRESLTDGELRENKLKAEAKNIKSLYKSQAFEILVNLSKLIKMYEADNTLLIESPDRLHSRYLEEIKDYFTKKEKRSLKVETRQNPELLGGIKVSIGDREFDYSVKEKISRIKEALSG